MFPVGVSVACSILTSNAIGANKVRRAKREARASSFISVVWVFIIIGSLNLFKSQILGSFNSNPEVLKIINSVWFFVNTFIMFDILQGMFMGVIRGLGIQPKASFVPLVGYWALGIPTCAVMVFEYDYGLISIYIGMTIAITFNFAVYGLMILFTDWNTVAEQANRRKEADLKMKEETED